MLMQESATAFGKACLDDFFGLTQKMADSVEQLSELNLRAARTAVADSLESAQKAVSSREVQEWSALQDSLAPLAMGKMSAYGSEVIEIALAARLEWVRFAIARSVAYGRGLQGLVKSPAWPMPAGAEAAAAALDTAITAANSLVQKVQQTDEQVVEVMRGNFPLAADAAARRPARAGTPGTRAR
ncbi:Phasin_2 domain-containing protein [Paraburkholderia tropica]|uniref:phasin family protein n=1 Tax=Paraburkholderia tropica TaxID=92647 RepID=UPI001CB0BD1C|nr:phasin family protein [Paraburkholderia tropica]CAG9208708.1 Phasin_2 domain-containing protein [Paraburkholderia tropica]